MLSRRTVSARKQKQQRQKHKKNDEAVEKPTKAQTSKKQNHHRLKLRITFQNLSDEDLVDIAKEIDTSTNLRELVLKEDRIMGLKGLRALGHVLQTHQSLVSIDLSDNYIGAEGASLLAAGLKENTTILKLDLSDNYSGDKGAEAIATTLSFNRTLLFISNQIGSKGGIALAKSISINTALKVLSLVNNPLGEKGVRHIADAMNINKNITHLSKRYRAERDIQDALLRNSARQATAFENASSSHEKIPWHRSKLMVVGEGMVGKTATVRSLLSQAFDAEWKSTVGVSMLETRAKPSGWERVNNSNFALDMMHKLTFFKLSQEGKGDREQDDLHSQDETEQTEGMETEIQIEEERRGELKALDEVLEIGETKRNDDQEKYEFMEMAGQEYSFDERLLLQAQKDVGSIRISIWDYGGQSVFYTLHHLLLTAYGVYLLVFDCRSIVNNPASSYKYVEFWLKSIAMHARDAPIILVGTFCEDAETADEWREIDSRISEISGSLDQIVKSTSQRLFFPIDNKTSRGIRELRVGINNAIMAQDFINIKVSLKWMKCLDLILSKGESWLKFSSVRGIAQEYYIVSVAEVEAMLDLFHELGILLYFTSTEALRAIVITNPQWLVDELSKIIRDSTIHSYDKQSIIDVGLEQDVNLLFNQALVTKDLLQYFWGKESMGFLLDLMKSLLLLSTWNFNETEDTFLVPSMLKAPEVEVNLEGNEIYFFEFSFGFLPDGVFERLVCLCVDYSESVGNKVTPLLFKHRCNIHLWRDSQVNLRKSESSIQACTSMQDDLSHLLRVLTSMLLKIRDEAMGEGFSYEIYILHDGNKISYASAQNRRIKPWFNDTESVQNSSANLQFFVDSSF